MYQFRKLWLSIILVLTGVLYVTSQNEVTVMVNILPPYTPYISDYIEDTGKVIVTLNYTSATGAPMDVYLHGSFTGSSTGINVYTDPNYIPPMPIHLENGQTYQLSPDEIGELYAMENVIYEGITPEEIMTSGALPEDYYQLCVRAYKYDTIDPVSQAVPSGCSTQFLITNIDPPIIVLPICGEEILLQNPQNIYVNWTPPIGINPLFITYYFRMVEVPFDSGIDPIDALTETSYASIYEEEVFNGTSLLLTNDKVQLSPNNTYAFSVQALSDTGDYFFKNNGVSEACWFTYIEEETDYFVQIDDNTSMIDDFIDQFEFIPETKVSGTLYYKVPESEHTTMSHEIPNPISPSENTTMPVATQGINYTDINNAVLGYSGNANTNYYGITNNTNIASQIHLAPPNGRGLLHKETETIDRNKPLANTKVRLVIRLAEIVDGAEFPSFSSASVMSLSDTGENVITDLEGNLVKDFSGIGMVLDVTETDENGNFSFDFRNNFLNGTCLAYHNKAAGIDLTVPADPAARFGIDTETGRPIINPVNINPTDMFTGFLGNPSENTEEMRPMSLNYQSEVVDAYICLKVEVVNQKFCSPDVDIFALPGDVVDVGDQVAKLKTYHANITVKSDDSHPQLLQKNSGIPNTKIKILRDVQDLALEHPIVLKEEGQTQLDSRTFTSDGEFKDVSMGLTSNKSETKGQLLLKNLVKHWDSNTAGLQFISQKESPYHISVATRDASNTKPDYENSFFNYKGKFELIKTTRINEVNRSLFNDVGDRIVTYNNVYSVPILNLEYTLKPEDPEIKGRVMATSNIEDIGMDGAKIFLFTQKDNTAASGLHTYMLTGGLDDVDSFDSFKQDAFVYDLYHQFKYENEITTPPDGFFSFLDLSIIEKNEMPKGPFRRILVTKEGYHPQVFPPFDQTPYNLNNGELVNIGEIHMIPSDYLKGKVVDEYGTPVVAYVRVLDNGPYYKTVTKHFVQGKPEYLNIAAALTGNKIEIDPLLSKYFLEEFEDIAITNERQTFRVYEKLHRLYLTVTGNQGEPVMSADVVVGDSLAYGKTDPHGIFKVSFASAGKQFILKINSPNFAPDQSILDSLDVSKSWTYIDKQLTPSFSIYGYISDKQSKEKIPNAHVFAELNNTDGHQLYIETTTDNEGYYTLYGIPWDYRSLEIHIEKEGNNPSYIGKVAEIAVSPHAAEYYNFELSPIEGWDLSQILGFPMQVEHFKTSKTNSNRAYIDGYLHHMPTTAGFAVQETDAKVFFKELLIERGVNGKVVPVGDAITLDNIQIPVKLNTIFTALLRKPVFNDGIPAAAKRLTLEKLSADQGQIKSGVKIDLQFNHTSISLDGDFYLGDNTNSYATTVFKSNLGNSIQITRRPVFDIHFDFNNAFKPVPVAIKDYTVFEFRADSDIDESYLEGNKISIKTILHTEIPMGNNPVLDLKMPIGSVVITQNNITIEKAATDNFSFMLENWEVFAKEEWYFDKNEDAIVLPEVLINSVKGFSASVTNLKVRPTELREGEVAISGGLSLGGIAPLKLADGLTPMFNYDATAGEGHYRISLIGNTNAEYVAWVDSDILQGTSDDIQFKSIGLLSDDREVLTLDKHMRFYDIMNVNVNQIMTSNGAFTLKGNPNFNRIRSDGSENVNTGIPSFIPSSVLINYEKDGDNEKLLIDIEPLQGQVDCNDNVVYTLGNEQHFSKGKFTDSGTLKVSPSALEYGDDKDSFELKSDLIVKSDDRIIDVKKLQDFKFGLTHKMIVTEGNTTVENNSWTNLTFKTNPDIIGLKKENEFVFTVTGNVTVNNDELKVEKVSFGPYGEASLAFNFVEPSVTGSYFYNGIVAETGYFTFSDPHFAFRFSPQGFYQAGGGTISVIKVLDFPSALIIGYTTEDITNYTTEFLQGYRAEHPKFPKGLKGFYTIGAFKPRWANRKITLIPEIASVDIGLEVGVTTEFNFEGDNEYIVAGYGYAGGEGKIKAEVAGVGCSASIGGQTFLLTQGKYKENQGFTFKSSGDFPVHIKACGYGLTKSIYAILEVNEDGERSWDIKLNK